MSKEKLVASVLAWEKRTKVLIEELISAFSLSPSDDPIIQLGMLQMLNPDKNDFSKYRLFNNLAFSLPVNSLADPKNAKTIMFVMWYLEPSQWVAFYEKYLHATYAYVNDKYNWSINDACFYNPEFTITDHRVDDVNNVKNEIHYIEKDKIVYILKEDERGVPILTDFSEDAEFCSLNENLESDCASKITFFY